MITLLSGGTGTPKLLRGVRYHTSDEKINVVVNTAEDVWISGGHLSPDIDTVMYLFCRDPQYGDLVGDCRGYLSHPQGTPRPRDRRVYCDR